MATVGKDLEVADPPADGISSIKYSWGNGAFLLASSWDATLRLYDGVHGMPKASFSGGVALLDGCFSSRGQQIFSAGVDGKIKSYDLETRVARDIGSHEKPVRCLEHHSADSFLVSGSWDTNLKLWDPRSNQPLLGSYPQPNKIFAMAMHGDRIVVGTAARHVHVYDVRKMSEPQQRRESSLKHQTRCIRTFPDGTGYALSSVEGRVAIEYFDPSDEVQKQKYVFKCHRTTVNGVDTVYPVNALAFHPGYGTFATGGCDGMVNIWDGANRKRICVLPRYPTSISSLAFHPLGTTLAVASSYTFEEGEKDHAPDAIYLHRVQDSEVKPKPRAAPAQ
jgi:cell cycle arrest protein BUB3